MEIEIPKVALTGSIREITLGKGDKAVVLGGETALPCCAFEGAIPHPPRIAMEIWDKQPDDWAAALGDVYGAVWNDPVAWAKKCVEAGADVVMLTLASTDPNGDDAPPERAAEVARKVAQAIDIPLIVWGSDNAKKNGEVLRKVAEAVDFKELVLGPVEEGNYKPVGAGAIGYKHKVAANSPIDVNLAKQINILLGNLGIKDENILIDPTTGGLGYGLEYSYSVIERARLAALQQGDAKLQFPIMCNIGKEVWKIKEVKTPSGDPTLGDQTRRGVAFESVTAATLIVAGADLVVLRHPQSVKLVRQLITEFMK